MAKWTSKTTIIAVLCGVTVFLLSVVWSMNERNTELLRDELRDFRSEFRESTIETRESYATIRNILIDAHPKFASALLAVASVRNADDPLNREQQQQVFNFLSGPMFEYIADPNGVVIAQQLDVVASLSDIQRTALASAYIHATAATESGNFDPKDAALMMLTFEDLLTVDIHFAARRKEQSTIDSLFGFLPPLWVVVLIVGGIFAIFVGLFAYEVMDD